MSTIVSKTFDSREECRNQGPILVTGAVVKISSAAPVVKKGPQCRQSSRESSMFGTRRREVPEKVPEKRRGRARLDVCGLRRPAARTAQKITAIPCEAV